jgi:hypothetical protein
MLTRSQVARRLGRSIATVRRAEGKTLHPTVDGRGVHRFDVTEVDALAAHLLETGTLEGACDTRGYPDADQRATRQDDTIRQVNELTARVAELERAARVAQEELEHYRRHVREVIEEVSKAAVLFAPELKRLMRVARYELSRRT